MTPVANTIADAPVHTSNWHSHTPYCDGHDTMEALAAAAAREGFTHWGFTPHSPLDIESTCNMHPGQIKDYLKTAASLKVQGVRIFKGMEVDFLGDKYHPAVDKYRADMDYLIGSVHFVADRHGNFIDIDGSPQRFGRRLQDDFNGEIEYVLEQYFLNEVKMLRKGGFEILGHCDKIALNASAAVPGITGTPLYLHLEDRMVEAAIQQGAIVEINTKHYEKTGFLFPDPRLWQRFIRAGLPMVVNSDAHYADKVNSGRRHALELLEKTTGEQTPAH